MSHLICGCEASLNDSKLTLKNGLIEKNFDGIDSITVTRDDNHGCSAPFMQVFQFPVRKVSISTVSAWVPEAVVFSGGFVPAVVTAGLSPQANRDRQRVNTKNRVKAFRMIFIFTSSS